MGIGGSVFVMFVLFQGADLLHPHPCMFFYRRACMCGYIHKQGAICTHSHLQRGFYIPFFDNVTWKRDLLVFSDNINCKSRSQTVIKLQLHHHLLLFYRHPCSTLL